MTREAAARATTQIIKREGELVAEFKKKGINIVAVDRAGFQASVLKGATLESLGFDKKDFDRIVALK